MITDPILKHTCAEGLLRREKHNENRTASLQKPVPQGLQKPVSACGLPSGKKSSRPNTRSAFTLIEMLVVLSLLSVVGMTMFATFKNGINIWHKASRQLPEEDLNIFFDKFRLDLRNSFKYTGIDFKGTKEKTEFPTLVNSQRLQKKTVGKLIYEYEPQKNTLNRYQLDYSDVYSDESNSGPQQSIENIRTLKFHYYLYDQPNDEYLWLDEWSIEGLPLAVRVELEFDNGAEIKKYVKTVFIPTGG